MAGKNPESYAKRFGIGEWFGELFSATDVARRQEFVELSKARALTLHPICPFRDQPGKPSSPCSKQGGVCSLKLYSKHDLGNAEPVRSPDGALRCLCPHRFEEGGVVREWIGEVLLGSRKPIEVAEVPFLKPEDAPKSAGIRSTVSVHPEGTISAVGRIDKVLVHRRRNLMNWCAVEMQAVYFSGPALSDEFKILIDEDLKGLPFPARIRRPDYRSSGPKRLMPQLQIKVPTLRRWGKKMAVVIDEAFWDSLGKMDAVTDVSNCDIAWFVVRFVEQKRVAVLEPGFVKFTTLERAVEGLTAGIPVTLDQFELQIMQKLARVQA